MEAGSEVLVAFFAGVLFAAVGAYFVIRNAVAKNPDQTMKSYADEKVGQAKTYIDQIEKGARAGIDELWDEVKETQVKLAELVGKVDAQK